MRFSLALGAPPQAIVRPYLDSKYHIRGVAQRPRTVLFGSAPGMSMRQWLFLWFSQLVQHHASGELVAEHAVWAGGCIRSHPVDVRSTRFPCISPWYEPPCQH